MNHECVGCWIVIHVEYCSYKGLTLDKSKFSKSISFVEYCSYKGLMLTIR